jgi:hypothetical protein
MNPEVVAEIEAQARELRASGRVRSGFEDELEDRFEEVAEQALAAASAPVAPPGGPHAASAMKRPASLAEARKQATALLRRRFGPTLRRLQRRGVLGAARAGEAAWLQVHVAGDHLERVTARSAVASRALSLVRPRENATSPGVMHPIIEGPLLAWAVERLSTPAAPGDQLPPWPVLHVECGDGRVVEALGARGLDARGADPRLSDRSGGDTSIVAAGALEYLGATASETLGGVLLSGVVDRLRPGAARALAQLVARCLAPGGVVVLVSARPEVIVAIDPVAADLAPGRPMHPVTWCHLLARFGLSELTVFEPDASEPDVFAVSARRPLPRLAGEAAERS